MKLWQVDERLLGARHIAAMATLLALLLVSSGVFAAETSDATCGANGKEGWTPLFNGKDLTGWAPEGKAVWGVENGCLVGKQGPGNTPGDLFTSQEYTDFEVRITYKIQWPANSGVWFRYQAADKSYQADILEYKNPEAYSGTIYCPAKFFLSVNSDKALEKRDDWNTMVIRAQGDHLEVTLNGKKVGDVHDDSYAKGKIGFQVHPGDEFKDMKITVKEAVIRVLNP